MGGRGSYPVYGVSQARHETSGSNRAAAHQQDSNTRGNTGTWYVASTSSCDCGCLRRVEQLRTGRTFVVPVAEQPLRAR
jgi:hypothetical protein